MNELQIIEQNGERVLTTSQLAEAYGADQQSIVNNFNRNKNRYSEGKHFILLNGNELREFRAKNQFDLSPNLNKFYLWTEKGAWLHAKSLNTDQAWDAYETLVDDYYEKKQQVKVLSEREQLIASMQLTIETSKELNEVKNEVQNIKQRLDDELILNHGQQVTLHHQIKKRVESIKEDYPDASKQQLYSQIHSHLRRAFAAPKYIFVKRNDYQDAMQWVKTWRPLL